MEFNGATVSRAKRRRRNQFIPTAGEQRYVEYKTARGKSKIRDAVTLYAMSPRKLDYLKGRIVFLEEYRMIRKLQEGKKEFMLNQAKFMTNLPNDNEMSTDR